MLHFGVSRHREAQVEAGKVITRLFRSCREPKRVLLLGLNVNYRSTHPPPLLCVFMALVTFIQRRFRRNQGIYERRRIRISGMLDEHFELLIGKSKRDEEMKAHKPKRISTFRKPKKSLAEYLINITPQVKKEVT